MPIKLSIDITADCPPEILEYIFDCWVTFVTQDLGWNANEAIMYEDEYVSEQASPIGDSSRTPARHSDGLATPSEQQK